MRGCIPVNTTGALSSFCFVFIFLSLRPLQHGRGSFYLTGGRRFGDQIVLFVADAAEIFICEQLVVIDKFGELVLASPEIHQSGIK